MKKHFAWWMAVILLACSSAYALAEGEKLLPNTAVIVDDTIYYSGSVDGETVGLFSMKTDGGNIARIYDVDMPPLAYSNGKLLAYSWDEDELLILDTQGNMIKKFPGCSGQAIASDGSFFVGNLMISDDGASLNMLFDIDEDYYLMLTPVAVDGGYLYYLDQREYGELAFGFDVSSELYRVSMADHSVQKLVGAGVNYIGMDDTYIYYTRENFGYLDMQTEQERETDFPSGLFKIKKDGTEETKLAESGLLSDESYIDYTLFADGVIYGLKSEVTDEGELHRTMMRVGVDGVMLPDMPAEDDTLHAVRGNVLITAVCVVDDMGNQEDKIFAVNLDDLSRVTLNSDGRYMIYFTEEEPAVALVGDRVYFVSYDVESGCTGLYAAKLDGGGVTKLASGVNYQDYEQDDLLWDE